MKAYASRSCASYVERAHAGNGSQRSLNSVTVTSVVEMALLGVAKSLA